MEDELGLRRFFSHRSEPDWHFEEKSIQLGSYSYVSID